MRADRSTTSSRSPTRAARRRTPSALASRSWLPRPTSSLRLARSGSTTARSTSRPATSPVSTPCSTTGSAPASRIRSTRSVELAGNAAAVGSAIGATAGTSVAPLGDPHERRIAEERGPPSDDSAAAASATMTSTLVEHRVARPMRSPARAPGRRDPRRGTTPCRLDERGPAAGPARRGHARDERGQLGDVQGVALLRLHGPTGRVVGYFLADLRLP